MCCPEEQETSKRRSPRASPQARELGDVEEFVAVHEPDLSVTRMPLLAMPGESPRGLLVKDLNLVVPLGLLWLALRFLLWVARGAPAEGAHAGVTT